jgi:integrase/recombinase XerD
VELDQVKAQHVLTFLNNSPAAAAAWRLKYYVILHFFDFWTAHEATPEIIMPPIRPKERQTFIPHVYSRAELRTLLRATAKNQQSNISIARTTMRTLIILLYSTGARVGEVLSLSQRDVDLERRTLSIRNKKLDRCREIPIGADLAEILRKYLAWKARGRLLNELLFVTKQNKPISVTMANKNFRRLREIGNVTRDVSASYQPRLHDLQCTFAVHRITSWIRTNADLKESLHKFCIRFLID